MRKVLVALILFFVITLCILITVFLIEPDDKYIDLETSKKNFIEYSNQIDDVFESNGYDPEEIISDDDYIREDSDSYTINKYYSFDDEKRCSIFLSNINGKEKFSITMYSPHLEDDFYGQTKLLYELSNILSGHHFTEKDISNVVKGKISLHSRVTRKSELIEGQYAHHYMWVGFFTGWYIDYYLCDDNPLYEPNLCDTVSIGGYTAAGTK